MTSILKKLLGGTKESEEDTPDYIEVDLGKDGPKKGKIILRPFVLKQFADVTRILENLREGYTIALIDIKPLKNKDIIELKRAISKLKKTVDALEGSVAGFGENVIVATPSFVDIYRGEPVKIDKVEKIE